MKYNLMEYITMCLDSTNKLERWYVWNMAIKIDIGTAIYDFGFEFFVLIDVSSLTS